MSRLWFWVASVWPMRYDGHAFTDVVSGEPVGYYTDIAGRRWMATSEWSLFRVALRREEGALDGQLQD